ncbi:HD domain-containing phosphohydrolase [Actinoplanes sp. DH11]|uniref:HD domain-containing phosphohydrolase n=1 Tax=Actinoplanes sp. DH11 TaxID=2857011 RepID=UPI001E5D1C62|nr:HD domain-containing phosphohydrolase [Actinoplanes sp. DH11]
MRTIRVAEVLAAVSLTTDVAAGMSLEKGLRTCTAATRLARLAGGDDRQVRVVFETALLRSIGCTSYAPELAALFGDDVALQAVLKRVDFADEAVVDGLTADFKRWAGAAAPELARTFVEVFPHVGVQAMRNGCETSRDLGPRLGVLPESVAALEDVYERWDGRGIPEGRCGADLSPAARTVHVAEQAVLAGAVGGLAGAVAEVRRRSGGHLDPALAEVFLAAPEAVLAAPDSADAVAAVLEAEPLPHATVPVESVPQLSAVLARIVDMKSPWLLGHSEHVADLAEGAGRAAGLDAGTLRDLRSAALLHDLGRVVIPAGIWDRPGRLTTAETERVRMHTYWTHRILQRVPALATIAPIASAHHERADGGGYHRGDPVRELPLTARIVAAADLFAALTEPRAHRPAYPLPEAARILVRDADEGGADKEACALVLAATGMSAPRRPLPDGLTDREVQVLRLAARGLTSRQVGAELSISPRTVDHHLTHIYDKTGRRTRAGIALYAMEHSLLR